MTECLSEVPVLILTLIVWEKMGGTGGPCSCKATVLLGSHVGGRTAHRTVVLWWMNTGSSGRTSWMARMEVALYVGEQRECMELCCGAS